MLNCFYGNLSFEKYFPKDYPLKVVDFEQCKSAQEMLNAINDPECVVLVKNAYKLKIYYEYYISRVIANSSEKIVVLSELRFSFFREIKRAMANFVKNAATLKNPIIFTFPLEENEGMFVNRIYPEGFKDFSLFGAQFHFIVPFVLGEKKDNPISITSMALSRSVDYSTFTHFTVKLNELLTASKKPDSNPN